MHYPSSQTFIVIFFQTRTYIHLFNQCIQNWFAVASILEDTLSILRTVKPNLKNAFLRSDNAGLRAVTILPSFYCAYQALENELESISHDMISVIHRLVRMSVTGVSRLSKAICDDLSMKVTTSIVLRT